MISAAPTVVALETNSAWILILATSLATLPLVLLMRRVINRPGGLASGVLLGLPLLLPLAVAFIFQGAVLPEIAVLRPALPSMLDGAGKDLFDLFWFTSERAGIVVPYALWGSPGPWLVMFGLGVSSFMLLRRAAGGLSTRRVLRRSVPIEETRWAPVDRIAENLVMLSRLHGRPRLMVLPPGVSGAFVSARRGGRIFVSRDLLESLSEEEIEAVLAHEVAHLEACDVPVVLTAGLLRDVVAWNPLAHVALRRLLRDREYEADRRAAVITGKPLAVASSLLKVYELSRRGPRSLKPRAAVPFMRRTARVSKRVDRLIALADRQIPMRGTDYLPFVAAAVLAAALALQVGMRIGGNDESAFAIVLGAPRIGDADVWSKGRARAAKPAEPGVPAANVEKSEIMRQRNDLLRSNLGVQTEDLARWRHSMTSLAVRRGIAPATVREELREGWHAVPLFTSSSGGSVAFFRIEHVRPNQLFGGLWGKTQKLRRSD